MPQADDEAGSAGDCAGEGVHVRRREWQREGVHAGAQVLLAPAIGQGLQEPGKAVGIKIGLFEAAAHPQPKKVRLMKWFKYQFPSSQRWRVDPSEIQTLKFFIQQKLKNVLL